MGIHLRALAFILIAQAVLAADEGQSTKPETAQTKSRTINGKIEKQRADDWAGTYSAGDGLFTSQSLVLFSDSRYISHWRCCVGMDRDHGTFAVKGGSRLVFTSANADALLAAIEPDMILVRWGDRRYLVPAKQIVGFCNAVNQGSEPRTTAVPSFYLLREGDERKEVRGLPDLPAEYRDYLLLNPVEATVIAVGASTIRALGESLKYKDTQVTLDAGVKQRLKAGMELVVIGPRDVWASPRITKVQENRAEAIISQWGEEEPGPKLGWRLSTRAAK